MDKTEELTELAGMTSNDRNDEYWSSWQVLTGMTSIDKADKCWQEWQMLTELTSLDRADKYSVFTGIDWTDGVDRYWQDLPNSADSDRV